jgi:hypothetical protein
MCPTLWGFLFGRPLPAPNWISREAAQFGVARTRTGIYSENAGAEKGEARVWEEPPYNSCKFNPCYL